MVRIRVHPRARRAGIDGAFGDRVKISVSSPPVDDKANIELCRFLAATAGVPKTAVGIIEGQTSRLKTVLIRGVSPERFRRILAD